MTCYLNRVFWQLLPGVSLRTERERMTLQEASPPLPRSTKQARRDSTLLSYFSRSLLQHGGSNRYALTAQSINSTNYGLLDVGRQSRAQTLLSNALLPRKSSVLRASLGVLVLASPKVDLLSLWLSLGSFQARKEAIERRLNVAAPAIEAQQLFLELERIGNATNCFFFLSSPFTRWQATGFSVISACASSGCSGYSRLF